MTAQRINGNCLSRSTKIFLIFDQLVFLFAVFLRHLTFPLRLYPFMRLYRVFPLLVAFSHSHSSFFHFVISLSTRPPTLSCCRTKLQNAAPPPIGGIPQSSCCMFVTKKRGVLLRRKMTKVEETVWRRRPRSSLFERVQTRGICGFDSRHKPPPISFAESSSIRQFFSFFFIFFYLINPTPPPTHKSIYPSSIVYFVLHVSPHDNRPPHPSRDPPFFSTL